MAALSPAEVLLAAWAHGGLDVKKPTVKGEKIEYTSCVGDVCTKHAFVPLPTDSGRTFSPSPALVVRLITSPAAVVVAPGMGFLAFVSLTSSRPTDHLLALLDNPYATGQQLATWLAVLLYAAHTLELLLVAAVLLSPPLRAPVKSVVAWAPLIVVLGVPVTLTVLKLRWAELKAKAK